MISWTLVENFLEDGRKNWVDFTRMVDISLCFKQSRLGQKREHCRTNYGFHQNIRKYLSIIRIYATFLQNFLEPLDC